VHWKKKMMANLTTNSIKGGSSSFRSKNHPLI